MPDWLPWVQMSENTGWKVMPWQWPDMPTYWAERMQMYWAAKVEVTPILQKKHSRGL